MSPKLDSGSCCWASVTVSERYSHGPLCSSRNVYNNGAVRGVNRVRVLSKLQSDNTLANNKLATTKKTWARGDASGKGQGEAGMLTSWRSFRWGTVCIGCRYALQTYSYSKYISSIEFVFKCEEQSDVLFESFLSRINMKYGISCFQVDAIWKFEF